MTGIDYSKNEIALCTNKHRRVENLLFLQGDAEDLPLENNECDILVNVESSHCYSNFDQFVAEVYRVLKIGGLFYFTDFRPKSQIEKLRASLIKPGFSIVHERDISENVFKSLEVISTARKSSISETFPRPLRPVLYAMSAAAGTEVYQQFADGRMRYPLVVLQKN